jgi:PTH1 family peptidyl-tRNA hydrolase
VKLLVGLGNPGKQYENTRHNVGCILADSFLTHITSNFPGLSNEHFHLQRKLGAEVLTFHNSLVIAKPTTFMNASGFAVERLTHYFKIPLKDTFVAHDDLDLPFKEYKLQYAKGPKDHRGIQSIEQTLKTSDFWRIRIGVDNREIENRIPGEEYVLQNFSSGERKAINEVLDEIVSKWFLEKLK